MSNRIQPSLLGRRKARGFSQQRLASMAGITRQSYAAIESGASVPSTDVALRLAGALGETVEELFRLPDVDPPTIPVDLVGAARPGPVRLARVAGRLLALPAHPGVGGTARLADGRLFPDGEGGPVVALFTDRPPPVDLVVLGCDPAFALVQELLRRDRDLEVAWVHRGSRSALEALADGRAHVAGVHLLDPETGEYNAPWIRRILPFPSTRIRFAVWEQGLILPAGNPEGIRSLADLARPGLRFLNREPGSGTRTLLEQRLADLGVPVPSTPASGAAASGHLAVAEAVAGGLADVGLGIRAAGLAYGLDVLPVAEEAYELVVPNHFLDLPAVQALLDVLTRGGLRAQVEALGGYDVAGMGQAVGAASPRMGGER